jgi:hypothetical protein
MTEKERQDWAEGLRTGLLYLTVATGALYGLVTILIFGRTNISMPWGVQVLLSALGSGILALVAFSSILIRQLALPVASGVAIYSMFNFNGRELYGNLYLCGLAAITMIAIGILESYKTTGRIANFWRSFLFHPLGWSTHFDIQTRVDRTDGGDSAKKDNP